MRPLLTAAILVILSSSASQAGFEWHPPSEKPAAIPAPQRVATAPIMNAPMLSAVPPPAPVTANNNMPRVPAQPVMAAPLPLIQEPEMQAAMPPSTQMRPLNASGLYINPYPLGEGNQAPELTSQSIEQAMAEKGGAVHPVQLGAGMTSGVRPSKKLTPTATQQTSRNTIPRPPAQNAPATSMTPMAGGEPAPLPSMDKMVQKVQSRPTFYAKAMGFGNDIPLELALSQIIPGEFNHILSSGVDPSTTVSWKGGKSWNDSLNDMLSPKGLTAVINGKQVVIQSKAQS